VTCGIRGCDSGLIVARSKDCCVLHTSPCRAFGSELKVDPHDEYVDNESGVVSQDDVDESGVIEDVVDEIVDLEMRLGFAAFLRTCRRVVPWKSRCWKYLRGG
jgi:hypothetical protein